MVLVAIPGFNKIFFLLQGRPKLWTTEQLFKGESRFQTWIVLILKKKILNVNVYAEVWRTGSCHRNEGNAGPLFNTLIGQAAKQEWHD